MAFPISTVLAATAQVLFVLLFSPLVIGVIRKIKARFQARQGASVFQPYFDLAKLLMKGSVKSAITSWIFDLSPLANFASVVIAAAILPMFTGESILSSSNLLLFIYIFAIGRFFMTLGGLDAASAFGGLGSSREMLLSAFIEPAMMIVVLFLAVSAGGSMDISAFAAHTASLWPGVILYPPHLLAAIAFMILLFAEMKRMPFDNPATHLELTMVHEAMILENSGPNLALMEWANAAKLVLLSSLFGIVFLPVSLLWQNPLLAFLALAGISLAIGALIAVVESIVVKVRLFKVTEMLMFALILALLAFLSIPYEMDGGHGSIAGLLAFAMLISALFFLMSATFARRVKLFVMNSIALALLLAIVALLEPGFDSYFRLGSTIVLKVIIAPVLLYMLFRRISKPEGKEAAERAQYRKEEFRRMLAFDPVFMTHASILSTLAISAVLIVLAFIVSTALGATDIMVPITISMILLGVLIIAIKPHVLLQLFGLLIMENGIVLLPTALSLHIPMIAEAATLLDTIVLISVSVALVLQTKEATGTLDSRELDELSER